MNTRHIRPVQIAALILTATSCSASGKTFNLRDPQSPLQLVRTIVLPNVRGRIDHMALEPNSQHLFIAEVANGSVDDVDLASGRIAGRISGLHEPQGIAWLPVQREIAVACGDGSVRFYRRTDRQEVARLWLGDDADNVRLDGRNGNLVVGFGSGGLAIINPSTHRTVRELKLPAHPEAFEILGSRVFVNVPNAHEIIVGDLDHGRIIQSLGTGPRLANYPMASDSAGSRFAVAFRLPGSVAVDDAQSGKTAFLASACGDADDLYFHSGQIVVICGDGSVDLISEAAGHGSVRVTTRHGARTGLLDAERGRLFVAAPAGDDRPAAIYELSIRTVSLSQPR